MRWSATCVLVLTGCGFQSSPAAPVDAAIHATIDAARPGPDAPPTQTAAFCDPTDATTIACFDFDDDTATDKSANHFAVHSQNLLFAKGEVGDALEFGLASTADIDPAAAFNVEAVTVEAWVHPTPPADFANVLDVNDRFALQIETDGTLHCLLDGSGLVVAAGQISFNTWTHVACTYDVNGVATLYASGQQVTQVNGGNSLKIDGQSGLSLAADNPPDGPGPQLTPVDTRHRLLGLLDQVRVSNRARTAHEICLDAGVASCP